MNAWDGEGEALAGPHSTPSVSLSAAKIWRPALYSGAHSPIVRSSRYLKRGGEEEEEEEEEEPGVNGGRC